MGDNLESFENENNQPLTHKRILSLMAVVIVASSISAGFIDSWQFGLGVLMGGSFSFLNYYWMKRSLRGAFERAGSGERPRYLGVQYILRYFALGLVLYLIFLTQTISVIAVIVGLSSFALAVVIEGIIRIFTTFDSRES